MLNCGSLPFFRIQTNQVKYAICVTWGLNQSWFLLRQRNILLEYFLLKQFIPVIIVLLNFLFVWYETIPYFIFDLETWLNRFLFFMLTLMLVNQIVFKLIYETFIYMWDFIILNYDLGFGWFNKTLFIFFGICDDIIGNPYVFFKNAIWHVLECKYYKNRYWWDNNVN